MKKIKYITGAILFFLAFILIGEFFVWHLSSFSSAFPSTTLYLQEGQNAQELIKDVEAAAKSSDVDVFAVKTKINSSFSMAVNIYGTENAKEYLESRESISEGTFKSLILGIVNLNYFALEQLPEESLPKTYFLIGEHKDNVLFKQELIDKYAGNFPRQEKAPAGDFAMIIGIWAIVFFVLLLISIYDIALTKREAIVRMVSGEPLLSFVMANAIKDLLVFSSMFFALLLTLNAFTVATYHLKTTIIAFLVFLVFNSLLYFNLLKTDFRKDVSSKQSAKIVLKLSYVYKCAAIVIAILIMSGNINLIIDGIDYYRQKDFFQEYSDYNYINANYTKKDALVDGGFPEDTSFAKELFKNQTKLALVDLETWNLDMEYVYADGEAKSYLEENIPELRKKDFAQKVYFIIPEKYADDPSVMEDMQNVWAGYYSGEYDFEMLVCKKTDTIAISNIGTITSSIKKDPIIIYNNLGASSYDKFFNIDYITGSTLFNVSKDNIPRLDKDSRVSYVTNANENYLYHLETVKRNMITGAVFLVIILIINSIISKSMLYYEYSINAVENCLKKLFGYGMLRTNLHSILLTVISSSSAIVISSILMLFLEARSLAYNLIGGVLIILIDLGFLTYYIHKTSRMGMNRIFKGGSI